MGTREHNASDGSSEAEAIPEEASSDDTSAASAVHETLEQIWWAYHNGGMTLAVAIDMLQGVIDVTERGAREYLQRPHPPSKSRSERLVESFDYYPNDPDPVVQEIHDSMIWLESDEGKAYMRGEK